MAYKIIITEKFENSAAKTSQWIEKEWSLTSSLEFDKKLNYIIHELSLNPNIGRLSARKNIRSLRVTKHNRVITEFQKIK